MEHIDEDDDSEDVIEIDHKQLVFEDSYDQLSHVYMLMKDIHRYLMVYFWVQLVQLWHYNLNKE